MGTGRHRRRVRAARRGHRGRRPPPPRRAPVARPRPRRPRRLRRPGGLGAGPRPPRRLRPAHPGGLAAAEHGHRRRGPWSTSSTPTTGMAGDGIGRDPARRRPRHRPARRAAATCTSGCPSPPPATTGWPPRSACPGAGSCASCAGPSPSDEQADGRRAAVRARPGRGGVAGGQQPGLPAGTPSRAAGTWRPSATGRRSRGSTRRLPPPRAGREAGRLLLDQGPRRRPPHRHTRHARARSTWSPSTPASSGLGLGR